MTKVTIRTEATVDLDVKILAQFFADLDDEGQCQFFVEVARIAKSWPGGGANQWYSLGGHLKNCACSTEDARQLVKDIAYWTEHSTHQ